MPMVVMPVRIGQLAHDERGAARSAARLAVVIGEQDPFLAMRSMFGVRPIMPCV